MKNKTCWFYLDGERMFDALQYALDNMMMLSDARKQLREEYEGRDVKFVVEY